MAKGQICIYCMSGKFGNPPKSSVKIEFVKGRKITSFIHALFEFKSEHITFMEILSEDRRPWDSLKCFLHFMHLVCFLCNLIINLFLSVVRNLAHLKCTSHLDKITVKLQFVSWSSGIYLTNQMAASMAQLPSLVGS